MRKILATLAMSAAMALAMATVFTACGDDNVLTSGKVIDKRYDDPDTWTELMCVSRDTKTYACTFWMPVDHSDGPHWFLQIQGYDTKEHRHVEWHEVSEAAYSNLHIGDPWSK